MTGTLVLRRHRSEKRVFFLDGDIVGAASNQPSESLGTLLVCQGWIDVETYAASLARMDEGGARHGEILVNLGALRREKLEQALRMQNLARLSDAGTWTNGTYSFEPGLPPKRGTPYPLWNVLQSGILQRYGRKRIIELGRAREDSVVTPRASVFTPALVGLAEPLAVLGRIDGKTSIGELVRHSDNQMLTFVNLLVLRALEVVSFSQPKSVPPQPPAILKQRRTAVINLS